MTPPFKASPREFAQRNLNVSRRCPIDRQARVNGQIRISPVRLISDEGEQLGIVPLDEARHLARDRGLDLVEVAPNARPVVVKMMDYGKWKYEQAKNAREAKKNEHQISVKQVKYRPFVDDHDFEIKTGRARRFLKEGNKVKITVMYQRRALRRPESGYKVIDRVAAALTDIAKIESRPSQIINRDLTMVLAPLSMGADKNKERPSRPSRRDGPGAGPSASSARSSSGPSSSRKPSSGPSSSRGPSSASRSSAPSSSRPPSSGSGSDKS